MRQPVRDSEPCSVERWCSVEISFLERLPARTLAYGGIGFSLGLLLSGMFIFLTRSFWAHTRSSGGALSQRF